MFFERLKIRLWSRFDFAKEISHLVRRRQNISSRLERQKQNYIPLNLIQLNSEKLRWQLLLSLMVSEFCMANLHRKGNARISFRIPSTSRFLIFLKSTFRYDSRIAYKRPDTQPGWKKRKCCSVRGRKI